MSGPLRRPPTAHMEEAILANKPELCARSEVAPPGTAAADQRFRPVMQGRRWVARARRRAAVEPTSPPRTRPHASLGEVRSAAEAAKTAEPT